MYGLAQKGVSKASDKYGFVDENQVRVEAGIALLLALYSSISIIFFAEFTIPLILVPLMVLDFILKIFISPQASIFSFFAKKIVSKKSPYLVGAVQKRFAWSLGLFLSLFVLFCILILSGTFFKFGILLDLYLEIQANPIPPFMAISMNPAIIACFLCILFMTLESVFGYCVGCKIYQKFVQWGIMKKISGQNCVGGVCEM